MYNNLQILSSTSFSPATCLPSVVCTKEGWRGSIQHQLSSSLMNQLTNLIIPLQLSRELYKSTLFMQNEPNSYHGHPARGALLSVCSIRGYATFQPFELHENRRKNEPKRTQNEPNFSPKLASFSPKLALFYKEIFAFANNFNLFAGLQSKNAEHSCGRERFCAKSVILKEKSFENTKVSEINPCPPVASRRPRGLGAEGPRLLAGQSVKSVSKIISAFSVNSAVKKSAEIRGYIFRVFSCDFVVEKNKIPAVKQEGKYVKMKKGKIPGVEFNLLIPYWHPDFSSALRNRGKLH